MELKAALKAAVAFSATAMFSGCVPMSPAIASYASRIRGRSAAAASYPPIRASRSM